MQLEAIYSVSVAKDKPGKYINTKAHGQENYEMSREWLKAAGVRAIKTVAQTFIATIGTSMVISEVNWVMVCSASVLAGVLSLATSLAGLPEVTG